MEFNLNKRIVASILKQIPENEKPAVYLINILNISRESIYRRLRGDIPFSIEELIKLASNLDFSIDTIYDFEKQNKAFFEFSIIGDNSSDFFVLMLKNNNELLERIKNAKKAEAIMAFNFLPPPFFICFVNLFKFIYYKFLYHNNDSFRNIHYSKTVLPDDAVILQGKMKEELFAGDNVDLILDMNIFLNLIKEIQYCYQRKLLTNEELLMLKEDTLLLIAQFENLVQTGMYGKTKIHLYLSSLCITSNTIYYNYDNIVEPLFWMFTLNPVIIKNVKIISLQLQWLHLLKRQSALITQSNEILQTEFFFQQRSYIEKYLSIDNAF